MPRVLVGMSGGVDSAVSAYLLKQQGYEVVAGFMKNYVDPENPYCHTKDDRDEAIRVAHYLGIQDFLIFDFRQEYADRIIEYIYQGYLQGITPNPDILCNNLVKFDLFLEKAMQYGFDSIATGHYARITSVDIPNSEKQVYQLLRGLDHNKDQSYFLSGLNQYQLSKSLFPIGELTKPQVRAIAEDIGLPNAHRKDSQGLCFIGNVSMKEFLKKKLPVKQGDIILDHTKKVGEHDGAWFWTIGQSRGLDLNIKAYITAIDVQNNIVHVSYEKNDPQLLHTSVLCHSRHRINTPGSISDNFGKGTTDTIRVKIRYRQDPPVAATLQWDDAKNLMHVTFSEAQRGIAPGQSIVAYDGDVCLGGGIIGQ